MTEAHKPSCNGRLRLDQVAKGEPLLITPAQCKAARGLLRWAAQDEQARQSSAGIEFDADGRGVGLRAVE
jgi:hypothetical protein